MKHITNNLELSKAVLSESFPFTVTISGHTITATEARQTGLNTAVSAFVTSDGRVFAFNNESENPDCAFVTVLDSDAENVEAEGSGEDGAPGYVDNIRSADGTQILAIIFHGYFAETLFA